jgi:hypothetical protein
MPAPPMPEHMERPLVGLLVIVVLLLVIMPALLYLLGWGVTRYTRKAPSLLGFQVSQHTLSEAPGRKEPARVKP